MDVIDILKTGGIVVMPTDTIYGIVGSTLSPQTVEEIYRLRKRTPDKPMIILISDLNDLNYFNMSLTDKMLKFLKKVWPNPVSVVLPIQGGEFKYLHRGTNSLAFRMPKNDNLLNLLKQVGPLIAPSANFEGEKPAETIDEANKYFGNSVFYKDGGKIKSNPSTLIELNENGIFKVLRQGAFRI